MKKVRFTILIALVAFSILAYVEISAYGTDCDAPAWLKSGVYARYLFTVTRGDVLIERNVISISIDRIDEKGMVKGRYRSTGTSNFTVEFSYNACRELPSVFSFYATPSQLRNLSKFLSSEALRLQVGTFSAYRWKYTLRNQMGEYNVVKWVETNSGLVLGEIAMAREAAFGGKAIQLSRYMYTLIDTNIIKLEKRFSEKNESSLKEIIEALKDSGTQTNAPVVGKTEINSYTVIAVISISFIAVSGVILYFRVRSKKKRSRKREK